MNLRARLRKELKWKKIKVLLEVNFLAILTVCIISATLLFAIFNVINSYQLCRVDKGFGLTQENLRHVKILYDKVDKLHGRLKKHGI